jgi:hypothetical protein
MWNDNGVYKYTNDHRSQQLGLYQSLLVLSVTTSICVPARNMQAPVIKWFEVNNSVNVDDEIRHHGRQEEPLHGLKPKQTKLCYFIGMEVLHLATS